MSEPATSPPAQATRPRRVAPDVVITGLGALSALGQGWQAHGAAGAPGAPALAAPSPLPEAWASSLPTQAAFQVAKLRPQPYLKRRKDLKLMSRDAQLALVAAGLALEDAGLPPMAPEAWATPPEDVGLFMGVGLEPGDLGEVGPAVRASVGEGGALDLGKLGRSGLDLIPPLSALKTLPNMALAHVSINLGLMGPSEALSAWGTAGLAALGAATEAIERGECEVALVGAADSDLDPDALVASVRLGALAPLAAADAESALGVLDAPGWVAGEGAAFVVLESRAHAARRGARPWGRVSGWALDARPLGGPVRWSESSVAAALGGALGDGACGAWLEVGGAAGASGPWREVERAALARVAQRSAVAPALVYPSRGYGACGAASGLLDLVTLLARHRSGRWPAPGGGAAGAVAALAWGPTGECAAVVCDRVYGSSGLSGGHGDDDSAARGDARGGEA